MKTYSVKYSFYENDPEKMQYDSKVFVNKKDAELYKSKVVDTLDNLVSIQIEEAEEQNTKSKYPNCRKIFGDKENGYQFLLRYKKDSRFIYAHKFYDSFNNRLTINMLNMTLTRYNSLDDTIDDVFTIDFYNKSNAIYSFKDKYKRKYNKRYIITSILNLLEKDEIEIVNDDLKVLEPITNFEIVHLEDILGYQVDQVV
jgi:hypothetical protein